MEKAKINASRCKGCGLCVQVCPKKIIIQDQSTLNQKGYHPAKITKSALCIGCAMCALMCPDAAITVEK